MSTWTMSTNPPPPPARSQFRVGDWLCHCGAHNFGRNNACITCNSPKIPMPMSPRLMGPPPPPRVGSFSMPSSPVSAVPPPLSVSSPLSPLKPPAHNHPLLTPSGRAFAIGGRVQNVSSDPLSPCIMYWPDNEPFPEPGQIRPSAITGIAHPPILNTGNKGPIAHQPGDWVCRKCNYLNWRRRKVCQTCLPYAEGNGDSISAAVQAERIALLTSVLSTTTPTLPPTFPQSQPQSQSTPSLPLQQPPLLLPRRQTTPTLVYSTPLPSPKPIPGIHDHISGNLTPPQLRHLAPTAVPPSPRPSIYNDLDAFHAHRSSPPYSDLSDDLAGLTLGPRATRVDLKSIWMLDQAELQFRSASRRSSQSPESVKKYQI